MDDEYRYINHTTRQSERAPDRDGAMALVSERTGSDDEWTVIHLADRHALLGVIAGGLGPDSKDHSAIVRAFHAAGLRLAYAEMFQAQEDELSGHLPLGRTGGYDACW